MCEHMGSFARKLIAFYSQGGGAHYAKLIWQQKDWEIMIGADLQEHCKGIGIVFCLLEEFALYRFTCFREGSEISFECSFVCLSV